MNRRRLLDELASLRNPKTLMLGVVSGYALTACFAVLTALAVSSGVLRWHWAFGALLGLKLVTNTFALIGLRMDRFALELGGLNVAVDAVVMTGAIWATGDSASPLVAIYTIEVTVLALLTNLTTTVLMGAFCLVLFVAMGLLTAQGILPQFPTPAEWAGRDVTYLGLSFTFVAFVIGAPTFYTAGILKKLRDNEQRLESRTHELIDAGKQKAQFMANITHELRTPLQGILGLSDLVAKGIYGEPTEKQLVAMKEVKNSARNLMSLIDDLLQLARLDAGNRTVHLTSVEVGELLATAVANAQWILANKQLRIELDLMPLPSIITDRAKLNQILINLLSNAVKFTPEPGTITVRARSAMSGDGVEISVEDTGIGIAPADLERVFEEFHQVDGSASRDYGGVGLGLSLVRRLLVELSGTISVTSELGRGSTFVVALPMIADPPCDSSAGPSVRTGR
ncbi:MAG: ATP-binding protein [Polyangiales bacterium]